MNSGNVAVDGNFIAWLEVPLSDQHFAFIELMMSVWCASSLLSKLTSSTEDTARRRARTSMLRGQNWFHFLISFGSWRSQQTLHPLKVRMSQLEMVE